VSAGRAAVAGAGIVGLSVAWFLQQEGYEVTVFDARGVAAGASAGNAGWITPGMVSPLPEPGVVGYALRSLFRRDSPLRVTPGALLVTARFLAAFSLNCTSVRWASGVESLAGICALAMDSYDVLERGGVSAELCPAPVVMAFGDPADAAPVRHELEAIGAAGLDAAGGAVRELSASELREEVPVLSARVRHGLRLEGQRWLQPLAYTRSLAESVQARGGQIRSGVRVDGVGQAGAGKLTVIGAGAGTAFDVVVLANGAWLGRLGNHAGVRVPLAAGRGYSLTVKTQTPLAVPLYLPSLRVACTPAPRGMRLAGTMEFRSADAPLDRRRIDAIVRSARDYLQGVDWDSISDAWVGPRPVTSDGLPVIGAAKQPGVFVAGGHGMWGMTLGPATGRLLAEYIAKGERPAELAHFDPSRQGYLELRRRQPKPSERVRVAVKLSNSTGVGYGPEPDHAEVW
jgi:D-amino-acid dehydrogenase